MYNFAGCFLKTFMVGCERIKQSKVATATKVTFAAKYVLQLNRPFLSGNRCPLFPNMMKARKTLHTAISVGSVLSGFFAF